VQKSAFSYPVLLLVFWTGLVLTGDYVVLETSVRQVIACRFATTTCQIIKSNIGRGAVSQRGVDIAYNYTVNGVDRTGRCYRYDSYNGAFNYAAILGNWPAGARRTVYYNPANPADCLLDPGLSGFDLLLMLFAIPINIATFAVWAATLRARRDQTPRSPAGGLRLMRRPGQTRVRLGGLSPLAAGFFTLALAAFVSVFPAVSITGFEPTLPMMEAIFGLVVFAGLSAFLWTALGSRWRQYDLRIDHDAQTVTFPKTKRHRQTLTVAWEEVASIWNRRRAVDGPSGTYCTYVPAVQRAVPDSPPQWIELLDWGWPERKAQAFSQWLSGQLGAPFKGIAGESEKGEDDGHKEATTGTMPEGI
jgi:hypothetical protein